VLSPQLYRVEKASEQHQPMISETGAERILPLQLLLLLEMDQAAVMAEETEEEMAEGMEVE
jgi:hypothetical protein